MEDSIIVFLYLSSQCGACNEFKNTNGVSLLTDICDELSLDYSEHNDELPPKCVLNNVKKDRIRFPFLYLYYNGHMILVPHHIVYRKFASAVNYISMAMLLLIDASKNGKTPNSSSVSPRRMRR